jgi:short-subunit dehydrogenase
MQLEGRRILLTGGSGGLGAPLADLLLKEGAELTIVSRRSRLALAARLVQCDLSSPVGIATAAAAVKDIQPEILVHLAGSQHFGFFDVEEENLMVADYHVNLLAPAVLTRAALPAMKRNGSGHVLFASSVFGAIPFAHFASYSSAKAGLAALCMALRRECRGSGITFTCAMPRALDTAMTTPEIRKFAAHAGFTLDDPMVVARRLVAAIVVRRGSVAPGFPENIFMGLSALAPALITRVLAGTNAKARRILSLTLDTQRNSTNDPSAEESTH